MYAVELSVGTLLGLGFFVLLLWVLDKSFPDATGLGDLVRKDSSILDVSRWVILLRPGTYS